jgi:hypothetical protein
MRFGLCLGCCYSSSVLSSLLLPFPYSSDSGNKTIILFPFFQHHTSTIWPRTFYRRDGWGVMCLSVSGLGFDGNRVCVIYYTIIIHILLLYLILYSFSSSLLFFYIERNTHLSRLKTYTSISWLKRIHLSLIIHLSLRNPSISNNTSIFKESYLLILLPLIHSILVGTYIRLFILSDIPNIPSPQFWPRTFYRSGWLRCVGFICVVFWLSWCWVYVLSVWH